jgi:hypothetical protein
MESNLRAELNATDAQTEKDEGNLFEVSLALEEVARLFFSFAVGSTTAQGKEMGHFKRALDSRVLQRTSDGTMRTLRGKAR